MASGKVDRMLPNGLKTAIGQSGPWQIATGSSTTVNVQLPPGGVCIYGVIGYVTLSSYNGVTNYTKDTPIPSAQEGVYNLDAKVKEYNSVTGAAKVIVRTGANWGSSYYVKIIIFYTEPIQSA